MLVAGPNDQGSLPSLVYSSRRTPDELVLFLLLPGSDHKRSPGENRGCEVSESVVGRFYLIRQPTIS
jgi:hypothetical protein